MMIVLSGTIGAGKTSLTNVLAAHYGTTALLEPVGGNPVLPLFYKDPHRYGFLLQIYFLNKRFSAIKSAMQDDNNVLDRSIYEDALFTDLNTDLGRITETENHVYHELLDNMMAELPFAAHKKSPDLLVHISVSLETELRRISKRGRNYEQLDADPALIDYYAELNHRYAKWFDEYDVSPKIVIDGDKYDFVSSTDDLKQVVTMIDNKLRTIRG